MFLFDLIIFFIDFFLTILLVLFNYCHKYLFSNSFYGRLKFFYKKKLGKQDKFILIFF